MRIIVTGGAGFIGSHLVDKLVSKNHRVVVVDNLSTGKKKFVNKKAKLYQLDINSTKLSELFRKEKPQVVFHLAAQKSVPFSINDPLQDAQDNIMGSLNVIENCLKSKVKKLIFTSSGGAIYGEALEIPSSEKTKEEPDSPYGLSKYAIDHYLANYYSKAKKLNYVSLRLSNVYGPRQDPYGEAGVIAIFVNNLLHQKQCYINGSGKQTRDFIYVSDVVEACLKSINKGRGIYNIGTSKETSINNLYKLTNQLIKERPVKFRPAIKGEVFRSVLKCYKAKKELNWSAKVNLKQGINKTIDYFK